MQTYMPDAPLKLCPEMVFAATPPYDGTLGRYYKLPADLAYALPDHLSLEDGAMMEPLSVGVHSVANVGNFKANQVIAVFGAGPVGLLCMAVAKALGAKRVIAVDINQARLDFAKSYAATDLYLPGKPNEGESQIEYSKRTAAEMASKLNFPDRGLGAIDLVIDASGAATCIQTVWSRTCATRTVPHRAQQGIYIVKHGGTFVQVGMGNAEVTLPCVPQISCIKFAYDIFSVTTILVKEINYKGSFRYGVCNSLERRCPPFTFLPAGRLPPLHRACCSGQD